MSTSFAKTKKNPATKRPLEKVSIPGEDWQLEIGKPQNIYAREGKKFLLQEDEQQQPVHRIQLQDNFFKDRTMKQKKEEGLTNIRRRIQFSKLIFEFEF